MIAKPRIGDGSIDDTPYSSPNPIQGSVQASFALCGGLEIVRASGPGYIRDQEHRKSVGSDVANASELLVFHQQHLDDRASAPEDIIGRLLGRLRNRLRRKFPHADGEMTSDAVNDSFMAYWANPQIYNASLGAPLEYYLYHAAECNLSNLLRGETRRKCREDVFGKSFFENSVELSSSVGNILIEDPIQSLTEKEKWNERFKCLKNPVDRELVELWKDGELRVAAFAKVLGVKSLALKLQKAAVKRSKDRLTKRLQRAKAKFGWTR